MGYNRSEECEENDMTMDSLIFLGFIGVWLLLQLVILPRLGVPT